SEGAVPSGTVEESSPTIAASTSGALESGPGDESVLSKQPRGCRASTTNTRGPNIFLMGCVLLGRSGAGGVWCPGGLYRVGPRGRRHFPFSFQRSILHLVERERIFVRELLDRGANEVGAAVTR